MKVMCCWATSTPVLATPRTACEVALKLARAKGIHTVSYTGNAGGAMKELSDINVIVPFERT